MNKKMTMIKYNINYFPPQKSNVVQLAVLCLYY